MKLWRKLSKKEPSGDFVATTNIHTGEVVGRDQIKRRNGRSIKQQMQMSEYMNKQAKMTFPLLDKMFDRAGIQYVLTKKQQEALKTLAAEQVAKDEVLVPELVESTNATV